MGSLPLNEVDRIAQHVRKGEGKKSVDHEPFQLSPPAVHRAMGSSQKALN